MRLQGVISAVLVTAFVYLSTVLLLGATVREEVLRDKFGESIGDQVVIFTSISCYSFCCLFGCASVVCLMLTNLQRGCMRIHAQACSEL
jgi:hypothetical protein